MHYTGLSKVNAGLCMVACNIVYLLIAVTNKILKINYILNISK